MHIAKRCLWALLGAVLLSPWFLLANDYYNATGVPQPRSQVASQEVRDEFASIETGIAAKLPSLSSNGSKLVRINSGATGLEAFADLGTLSIPFSSACTVTPTVGFDYSKVGHQVTLQVSANGGLCTGNSTSFATAAAALPAELRPTYVVTSPTAPGFVDNGNGVLAALRLAPDGTMSFLVQVGVGYTTWTASGSRQASGISISYVVP